MKTLNLTQQLVGRIEKAKQAVKVKLFNEWQAASDVSVRETIHAKVSVIDDLSFAIITNIREDFDDNIWNTIECC